MRNSLDRPMKVVQNTLMEFSGGPDGVQLVEFSESFPANYSTLSGDQQHTTVGHGRSFSRGGPCMQHEHGHWAREWW
jgi:hypothetical protein